MKFAEPEVWLGSLCPAAVVPHYRVIPIFIMHSCVIQLPNLYFDTGTEKFPMISLVTTEKNSK